MVGCQCRWRGKGLHQATVAFGGFDTVLACPASFELVRRLLFAQSLFIRIADAIIPCFGLKAALIADLYDGESIVACVREVIAAYMWFKQSKVIS